MPVHETFPAVPRPSQDVCFLRHTSGRTDVRGWVFVPTENGARPICRTHAHEMFPTHVRTLHEHTDEHGNVYEDISDGCDPYTCGGGHTYTDGCRYGRTQTRARNEDHPPARSAVMIYGNGTARDPFRLPPDEARQDGWHGWEDGTGTRLAYVYVVPLTENEARSLAWVAARYSSAHVLWAHTDEDENGTQYVRLREHEAWEYVRTLDEDEDGSPLVPPCVGGTLADKLADLHERIT